MSDKMRWRYGDTNPVVAAVDSSIVIEIGDLLWQDAWRARPASDCRVEDESVEWFAEAFLGVAMQRSRAGDADGLRVATTGVFEFDCPLTVYELGDMLGACGGPNGCLANQQVMEVYKKRDVIGYCAKRDKACHSVLVDIRSVVMAR